MHRPKEKHWEEAFHVLRYLKGNPVQGVLLRDDSNLLLKSYCYYDYEIFPVTL